MKLLLLHLLLATGLVAVLAVDATIEVPDSNVFERISKVFDSVDRDTSRLTASHFAELRSLGFTDGDIESLKIQEAIDLSNTGASAMQEDLSVPRFAEKRVNAQRRRALRTHAGRHAARKTPDDVITPQWPSAPAGFTDTGFKFWVKAFIPGRGMGAHLGYVDPKPECAASKSPGYPKDGMRDPYLFPAPPPMIGPLAQWVKGDARDFSNKPSASHRIGAFCALFKRGSGRYKVACNKSAGWSRHWKREGLLNRGCWYVSCEALDNFSGRVESGEFTGSLNQWALPISGKNPCVTPQALTPAINLDMKITLTVSGHGGSIKFGGTKGRFPAMEGYIQDGSNAPVEWFRFGIGTSGVLMLAAPGVRVDQDPRTFTCTGC